MIAKCKNENAKRQIKNQNLAKTFFEFARF